MTFTALINLFFKNWGKITLFFVIGVLLGGFYASSYVSPVGYQTRSFATIGVSAESLSDSSQLSEDFAETLVGIIKGGEFTQLIGFVEKDEETIARMSEGELDEYNNKKNTQCSASNYEKSNLVITCGPIYDKEFLEIAAKRILPKLDDVIMEYNESTGMDFAIGYSVTGVDTLAKSSTKYILAGGILFVILGFGLILLFQLRDKTIWDTTQIEVILRRKVPEVESVSVSKLSKVGDMAFIGGRPRNYKTALSLPDEIEDFKPNKNNIFIVLDRATENEVKIIAEFVSPNTKIFAVLPKKKQ